MATFKVGQRVRFISGGLNAPPLNAEGVIVARARERSGWDWVCDFPTAPLCAGDGTLSSPTHYYARSHHLAPLTDPRADEFIERIKKLKPYDEPTVPQRERSTSLSGRGSP